MNNSAISSQLGKDLQLRARAAGVLLGTACGDALGAGYEFGPPLPADFPIKMKGGGTHGGAPGEWTDDTSMAVAIAEAALQHDLRLDDAQDLIAARWIDWARTAPDVGIQTRTVLSAGAKQRTAEALRGAASANHERTGRSGGNGSLMRTAPVALAFLDDPEGLATAARAISDLTHPDQDAGDACVIWCLAIRHAVLTGTFDGVYLALDQLPSDRAQVWRERLAEAETNPPSKFDRNGWVVQALQAAWSAITRTPVPAENPAADTYSAQHFQLALEEAVRGGNDTDTVAAIAGSLLGARWGVSAVPLQWQRIVHGWPGLRANNLVRISQALAFNEPVELDLDYSWLGQMATVTAHPRDPGILLGPIGAIPTLPSNVDAIVSLCRIDSKHVPASMAAASNPVEVWLIDTSDPAANEHLHFVLAQAADAVVQLRSEGRTVFLHCAAGQSRTPTVAALVGARLAGISPSTALAEVLAALPDPMVNPYFHQTVQDWV